jgi:small subunit ribosomal protein S20
MPVIKSAKKKLRQDKKRQERNKVSKDFLKKVLKDYKKAPSEKGLQAVFKATDKSVKKHLMHKNKAAHIKSAASKLVAGTSPVKTASKPKEEKVTKPTVKKASVKKTTKSSKK